ncbi:MAG: hypothetical protein COZ06_37710 [Armatimonadetes bacterium CG_4_10_14_3_um_filter_66_18]|nr:hypothetical protein [Armatimonadota bacterium]OIO94959.1 MAG: hypothetical protein AUJ96_27790 [Armatimonadetes bacterium CG2_30_66_41]PIU88158.1 MAG: hypothetical protein COS65_31225 [Armatimonadetes bacterium CG06_land_8_20_14_3_00_66_21]PIX36827.1 MAG: hypothetical protein COZ57_37490 [Armatimonadetes bacterium CG_4_8_14_3_um_filter_66_20]PIY35726.1 MAG: hypothetical protein COZ06_37710 [Armatimonadetes bacterium CG_4_10_14_3_um_filter_66_18]PIZ29675.1 MAG: hypothetical protein COY42_35
MRLTPCLRCAVLSILVCGSPGFTGAPPIEATMAISPRGTDFLVGEPLSLAVTIRRAQDTPVKAIKPFANNVRSDIRLSVSSGVESVQAWATAGPRMQSTPQLPITMKPGEPWLYEVLVHCTPGESSRLVFPSAGKYRVTGSCFLAVLASSKDDQRAKWRRVELQSNAIDIRFRAPTGDDARVWRHISGPPVARFIQTGATRDANIVGQAVSALRQFQDSPYHPWIRRALEFYHAVKYPDFAAGELDQLQSVGIGLQDELFPHDPRLDAQVKYRFHDPTPLSEIVREIGRQSRVPLSVHRDLQSRKIAAGGAFTVRYAMKSLRGTSRSWVVDGRGYKLVPSGTEAGDAASKTEG